MNKTHPRKHSLDNVNDHESTITAGKMMKANVNGLPEEATNTDTQVSNAVSKSHDQNTDQKLDEGGVNEVAVGDVKDAVDKKHSQNSDTQIGPMAADINMNSHKLTGLSAPASAGDSLRQTSLVTEANLEDLAEKYLPYGAEFNKATNSWTRLGRTAGMSVGVTLDDSILSVQADMTGVVLDDLLNTVYELLSSDHTKKKDGSTANLDGTDGNVFIRKRIFFYQIELVSADVIRFYVSRLPLPGFAISPMHYRNGKVLDFAYIGKYPGVLWDASAGGGAGAYVDGTGSAQADAANDKLSSVSGYKPFSSETRAEFRQMARNRGDKFFQLDAATRSSLLLLLVTEYATGDFQAAISAGNTQFSAWDFATCIAATGKSNADGMVANGQSTPGGDSSDYVTWRGIEDFWGNLWQWLDGLNVYNIEADGKSYAYFCDNPENFADNTIVGYDKVEELPILDGYQKMVGNQILPTEVGGASNTHFADYFYTYYNDLIAGYGTDFRVAFAGGTAYHGSSAGAFSLYATHGSPIAHSSIGGRLCAADI